LFGFLEGCRTPCVVLQVRARVESITASSAIEGVVVPDLQRARRIINGEAGVLRTRSYQSAQASARHHPVLLVGLAVLDPLVIHPFADRNGRVARAVTNALLIDAGYEVCRWVSLEQSIADSADQYYETLLRSTHDWHQDSADPWPWLSYFVNTLASAYDTFARKAAADRSGNNKQERVRTHVLKHAAPVFKLADVRTALPGISDQTIRLVLDQLKTEGEVTPEGTGRAARWRRAPSHR
jgi:hypothetical protein